MNYLKSERRRSIHQNFDFSEKIPLQSTEEWKEMKTQLEHVFKNGDLAVEIETLIGVVKDLLEENPATTFHSILLKSLTQIVGDNLISFRNELRKCQLKDFFSRLKAIWVHFSGCILQYIQGVFLPLDERLEERNVGMSIQKILLAEFRDTILLDHEVKLKLEKSIISAEKSIPPIILQMVEVLKRIESQDLAEKELHQLFSNTGKDGSSS